MSTDETAPTGIGAKLLNLLNTILGRGQRPVKAHSEAWRKGAVVHLRPLRRRTWDLN